MESPSRQGRTVCDCNLAPLCRFHHRLKTHGGWVYTRLDQTAVLWRSPHGLVLLRDHTGTRDLTGVRHVREPANPGARGQASVR